MCIRVVDIYCVYLESKRPAWHKSQAFLRHKAADLDDMSLDGISLECVEMKLYQSMGVMWCVPRE